MLEPLFAKLGRRGTLSAHQRGALAAAVGDSYAASPRETVVPQGVPQHCSNLLVDGYVARYKDLPDGQRQILQISLPGDFIDLPSFLLKTLEHDLVTLTTARLVRFPHEALLRITEDEQPLARQLWTTTLVEAAGHREQILSIGRRSALGRVAHLFCELFVRHETVGMTEDHAFPLPFTQGDIAEATGMTPVHVNRVFRRLRESGLIAITARRLQILDWPGLARVAEFDPSYLYLDPRPAPAT
ncbi:Crp/Fnr family transcriptional regulator [Sphingomonas jatrophae]|uniref:cAMP-binding domain of CRP or a regulatory subunit of cAMP-dependent protein kinases n=1 Tax=Sphingomonas jatrophae TaxID=1166337 RepID=A0A1I6M8C3_9SPHN|nr:Crp/Fnr family transcriptional regulator [Sphingomonas jatrophae]SFS11966.1 cAMP-binding domain of CRP or a regulatory subunit of cAMP-dependent protein kinases [Sphingomonas jatrophae]